MSHISKLVRASGHGVEKTRTLPVVTTMGNTMICVSGLTSKLFNFKLDVLGEFLESDENKQHSIDVFFYVRLHSKLKEEVQNRYNKEWVPFGFPMILIIFDLFGTYFFGARGMYHAKSPQLLNRFFISMAHSNRLIPSFHFRGRKKESSD